MKALIRATLNNRPAGSLLMLLCLCMMVGCLRTRGDVEGARSTPEAGAQAGEEQGGGIGGAQRAGVDVGGEDGPVAGMPGGAVAGLEAGVFAGEEGGSAVPPDELLLARLGIHFVEVEGGEFEMGATSYEEDELPIRTVRVSAFELMDTEVTVAQYKACVEEGHCSEPSEGMDCNWGREDRLNHPMNCVDWGQARTFAKWLGSRYDLPTEAEWEYAARGGEGYLYAGSSDPELVACFGNDPGSTCPVKSKQMNGYELFDMSGNVLEWTLDEYHPSYSGAPEVADQPWGAVPECYQLCQPGVTNRVFRGGSWIYFADGQRVTKRFNDSPDARTYGLGFRLKRVAQ